MFFEAGLAPQDKWTERVDRTYYPLAAFSALSAFQQRV
jgi:hypothetical protein